MDENSPKITDLINRAEVTSVVNSYFCARDDKNLDAQHFASIFTARPAMVFPTDALDGDAGFSEGSEG